MIFNVESDTGDYAEIMKEALKGAGDWQDILELTEEEKVLNKERF